MAGKKKDLAQEIFKFLLKPCTLSQIMDHFKVPQEEAEKILGQIPDGYKLHTDQNVFGKPIYYFRKKIEVSGLQERIWVSQRHKTKPYIVIDFPAMPKWKKINIVPISDVLFGGPECDMDLFDQYIGWLLSEDHAFAFLNGDILAPVPKRGLPKDEYDHLMFAYQLQIKIAPVAHKILWAQQGDEEEKVYQKENVDPLQSVCEEMGIPYFNEPVYADVCWNGHIFSFFCFHGRTSALLKGTKINAALRPRDFQEHTMFTVMGHAGDGMSKEVVRLCQDPVNFQIIEGREYYLICPSFRKYFGSPNAKKGYPPLSKGALSCRIYANGNYQVSS